jgi:hypothetical protein
MASHGSLYYLGVRDSASMYRATVQMDGSLGVWEPLAVPHVGFSPILLYRGGWLWLLGGKELKTGQDDLETHGATFDGLGKLGPWSRGAALPYWRAGMAAVISCNFLMLVGGTPSGSPGQTGSESVYYKIYR